LFFFAAKVRLFRQRLVSATFEKVPETYTDRSSGHKFIQIDNGVWEKMITFANKKGFKQND
jgi:hypothetical protein